MHVIGDLSLSLGQAEIVSIVGPSGCGKSTLLNVVSGIIPPDSGEIRWYGEPLAGVPARAGYMLQKDLLLPWRTAIQNVLLGLEIQGVKADAARNRAEIMLDRLGLHGFAASYLPEDVPEIDVAAIESGVRVCCLTVVKGVSMENGTHSVRRFGLSAWVVRELPAAIVFDILTAVT